MGLCTVDVFCCKHHLVDKTVDTMYASAHGDITVYCRLRCMQKVGAKNNSNVLLSNPDCRSRSFMQLQFF